MKKILFVLLVLALLVCVFGVTANATTDDFTTKTMNNFTATSTTTVDGNKCQYYFDGDLHLVLTGTNTLNLSSGYGIYVEGHLTISGTGTLNISNATTGIYVGKDLTIESGTITAPSIKCQGGSYIMNGGAVTVTGNVDASNKDFTMNGGTLIAANAYAKTATITDSTLSLTGDLDADSTIEITNSTVDANYLDTAYSSITIQSGTVTAYYVTPYGDLYIYGGTVTAYSISNSFWNSDVYIYGGTIVTDRISFQGNFYVYGGSLTVSDYFYSYRFDMYGGTVYVEPRLSIYIEIYISGGNLTAKNGLSNNYTIYYGIDIRGGTVNVESSEYSGISASGSVSITGGTVTIESNSYGISAGANINLTGGTVSIYGGEQALKATSTITWNDKSCVTYYTGKNETTAKETTQYYSEKYVRTTEQHTWDNGTVITAATHLATGTRQYTCTSCSYQKTEVIPKIEEHTFNSWTYANDTSHTRTCECGKTETASHNWKEATCVSKKICTDCKKEVGEVSPENHELETGSYTKTEDGYHQKKWNCCNAVAEKEKHSDKDKDHDCDQCNATVGTHEAPEGGHICEYCKEAVSKCKYDSDGYCKICGKNKEGQTEPIDLTALYIILAFVGGAGIGAAVAIFVLPHLKKKKTES